MNKETKAELLRRLVTEEVDRAIEEVPVPVATAESQSLVLFIDEERDEYITFTLVAANRTLQKAQGVLAGIANKQELSSRVEPKKRAPQRGEIIGARGERGEPSLKNVGKQTEKGFPVNSSMIEVVAEVKLEEAHTCDGYIVYTGAAGKGYGPLIYDIAMAWATPAGGMMSSRNSIKPAARSLWVRYYQRPDVAKIPLIKNPLRRLQKPGAGYLGLNELPCEFDDDSHGKGMSDPLELTALNHKYLAKNPVDYKKLEENGKRLLLQLQHEGFNYDQLVYAVHNAGERFFQRMYSGH